MIRDGRALTGLSLDAWARSARILAIARTSGVRIPSLASISDAEAVPAVISLGSWKVECPTEGCARAENVWREGPLVFFCLGCGNRTAGGRWRRVEMPADVDAAEAELLEHPNWLFLTWRPE